MTSKLQEALQQQKQQTQQEVEQIPGMLGVPLGGQRVVEVAGRNSYLYVRLRNNQSEVIQAYNNQVAPAYNLPVLVERQGNRYVVIGVDTQRYENNWNSFAPFLPRHGNTHSFDIESGGGGDIVWVYPRQFMPAMVMPSGSLGAGDVFVNAYTLKKNDNTWMYVGNTGTTDLLMYRPTSSTGAIMALVYLDVASGNPYLFINSGTIFSNSITGSSQIAPYIPSITDPTTQIPLAAVRLITGTNAISWDNIYDVRQWIHPSPTGTGGGGSLTVQDEGVSQGTATTLNFVGDNVQATVVGSVARIYITGSAGGGINTGTLDARYLKLDASNDPVTGPLTIQPGFVGSLDYGLSVIVGTGSHADALGMLIDNAKDAALEMYARNSYMSYAAQIFNGLDSFLPAQYIDRYAESGSGSTFMGYVFDLGDHDDFYTAFEGGTLRHIYNHSLGTTLMVDINPWTYPSGTVAYFNSINSITPAGRLLSLENQGDEKFYINGSGTAYSNDSPLIKEAPVDGSSYVRKNAGWEVGGGSTIAVQDEGISKGNVSTLNFVGASVDVSVSGSVARIMVTGTANFLPFGVYINLSPHTASPSYPYMVTVDRAMTLTSFAISLFVSTTNDGSNYWTIDLKTHPGGTTLNSINTSAIAPDTWVQITDTSFADNTVDVSDKAMAIICTKTGNPSNLYLTGPLLEVSL